MNRRQLRVLAFEPFDTASHRAVRKAISRHSRHEWTWITRPGRNWKWRMRLAAVEMAEDSVGWASPTGRGEAAGDIEQTSRAVVSQAMAGGAHPTFDAIFVTSLMSAADFRAMLPVGMRGLPLILYMHENQAAYPESERSREAASGDRDVHFALTNLTSILAADRVVWNSEWNRRSFVEEIERILGACSDLKVPVSRLEDTIAAKSTVVWPPVDVPQEWVDVTRQAEAGVLHNTASPVKMVWPHRWEHDKGPDELLAIAERWSEELNLRWTILGERYGEVPPELIEFEKRFAPRIDHMGYVEDRAEYLAMLRECDWVLSTARHEFFGIAVVEALLAGCLPWLPERLSYPELLPAIAKGLSPMNPPSDLDAVRAAIRSHLSPAIAANAVSRLDHVVEELITVR